MYTDLFVPKMCLSEVPGSHSSSRDPVANRAAPSSCSFHTGESFRWCSAGVCVCVCVFIRVHV